MTKADELKPLAHSLWIDYMRRKFVQDIQQAADLMRPVYDASNAIDGYVSLEVSPAPVDDDLWSRFAPLLGYHRGDLDAADGYHELAAADASSGASNGQR